MPTSQGCLTLFAAVVVAVLLGQSAADARGLPPKQKFEVTYKAEYGQDWYAYGDDNQNWSYQDQCIVGIGGNGTSQFDAWRNPPAYLNIIAGKGAVSLDVAREKEQDLIDEIFPWCPFYGTEEGHVEGGAKLPAKKLFDGKPHTLKGKARRDQLGPSTHQAEGYSEWTLTIRYLKPKPAHT